MQYKSQYKTIATKTSPAQEIIDTVAVGVSSDINDMEMQKCDLEIPSKKILDCES